jgi:hypothetical protein
MLSTKTDRRLQIKGLAPQHGFDHCDQLCAQDFKVWVPLHLYFPTICSGDGLFSQMNSRRSVSGSKV